MPVAMSTFAATGVEENVGEHFSGCMALALPVFRHWTRLRRAGCASAIPRSLARVVPTYERRESNAAWRAISVCLNTRTCGVDYLTRSKPYDAGPVDAMLPPDNCARSYKDGSLLPSTATLPPH